MSIYSDGIFLHVGMKDGNATQPCRLSPSRNASQEDAGEFYFPNVLGLEA